MTDYFLCLPFIFGWLVSEHKWSEINQKSTIKIIAFNIIEHQFISSRYNLSFAFVLQNNMKVNNICEKRLNI